MRPTRRLWPFVALAVLVGFLRLHAALPSPQGPINDFANILDASAKSELAKLVDDARKRTSVEIAVVTVPSLDGMTVEPMPTSCSPRGALARRVRTTASSCS
jgi:uncharacterized membrane protein YgcG